MFTKFGEKVANGPRKNWLEFPPRRQTFTISKWVSRQRCYGLSVTPIFSLLRFSIVDLG